MTVAKVKGYRNMLGLSQKEMAKKLNLSENGYRLKESGQVEFKASEMATIKELINTIMPELTIEKIFFN